MNPLILVNFTGCTAVGIRSKIVIQIYPNILIVDSHTAYQYTDTVKPWTVLIFAVMHKYKVWHRTYLIEWPHDFSFLLLDLVLTVYSNRLTISINIDLTLRTVIAFSTLDIVGRITA